MINLFKIFLTLIKFFHKAYCRIFLQQCRQFRYSTIYQQGFDASVPLLRRVFCENFWDEEPAWKNFFEDCDLFRFWQWRKFSFYNWGYVGFEMLSMFLWEVFGVFVDESGGIYVAFTIASGAALKQSAEKQKSSKGLTGQLVMLLVFFCSYHFNR